MQPTSEVRSIASYDSLQIESAFTVELVQSNENHLEIIGAEKIVDKIDSRVENNTLIIKNKFKGNWMHPSKNKIKLKIHFKNLSKISLEESCNVTTTGTITSENLILVAKSKLNNVQLHLNTKNFQYWNNWPCGGKIELSGNSEGLAIWNYALMQVDASHLVANKAYIENHSKGNCKASIVDTLMYSISGIGNIELSTAPQTLINKGTTGEGKLIIFQ